MLSFQRRAEIKNLLLREKTITVSVVAEKFGVSDETIRRDLNVLSDEGFCNKTYGGASLAVRSVSSIPQRTKKDILVQEKRRMAKAAAGLIRPQDCIFLDHSTTISEMCGEIKEMHLTVVTNSLWVIAELSDCENINLVITGGHVNTDDRGLFGQECLGFLRNHHFDKVFFSCRGLQMEDGIFSTTEHSASFYTTLSQRAEQMILLADHTKIDVPGFIRTMDYDRLDTLVTDGPLERDWMKMLERHRVSVICAPEPEEDPEPEEEPE